MRPTRSHAHAPCACSACDILKSIQALYRHCQYLETQPSPGHRPRVGDGARPADERWRGRQVGAADLLLLLRNYGPCDVGLHARRAGGLVPTMSVTGFSSAAANGVYQGATDRGFRGLA